MDNTWKGSERREMNQTDHDLLITISNDMKHMVEWTKSHTDLDDSRHKENLKKFDKIDFNLEDLKRFKLKSTAIMGTVLVITDLVIRTFFK